MRRSGNRKEFRKVVLLILESLGSTELLFILAMALVFFGPRKLPQLSRSLGKSMAEFRRASEDFKRTWDREVTEEVQAMTAMDQPAIGFQQNSIMAPSSATQPLQAPTIEAVSPDRVVARQTIQNNDSNSSAIDHAEPTSNHSEPARKRDWL
jgi:sec-independent protein translocase protein TatB